MWTSCGVAVTGGVVGPGGRAVAEFQLANLNGNQLRLQVAGDATGEAGVTVDFQGS